MNNVILTDEQQYIIKDIINWFNSSDSDQIYQFSGPAGTGKTFILHKVIEELGLKTYEVAPMAFTGSASIIMRLNGFPNARTIHSSIYKVSKNVKENTLGFEYTGLPHYIRLIVLDEAGMVDTQRKEDLVKTGVKILATGDIDQIPPILDKGPVFFNDPTKVKYLTKIMRQGENSAIIQISNMIKNNVIPNYGTYNNGEVIVIDYKNFINNLPSIIDKYDIVLCGKNSTRDYINNQIRTEIKKYKSPFPIKNEPLVCRKNNWTKDINGINLVNGLYGFCENTITISDYDKKGYFNLDFRPNFLSTIFKNLKVDYKYFNAPYKEKQEMKGKIWNVSSYEYFEYAYSCTVHASQGSQYNKGVYIAEYIPGVPLNKLNYTGITRFRERCLYVLL